MGLPHGQKLSMVMLIARIQPLHSFQMSFLTPLLMELAMLLPLLSLMLVLQQPQVSSIIVLLLPVLIKHQQPTPRVASSRTSSNAATSSTRPPAQQVKRLHRLQLSPTTLLRPLTMACKSIASQSLETLPSTPREFVMLPLVTMLLHSKTLVASTTILTLQSQAWCKSVELLAMLLPASLISGLDTKLMQLNAPSPKLSNMELSHS